MQSLPQLSRDMSTDSEGDRPAPEEEIMNDKQSSQDDLEADGTRAQTAPGALGHRRMTRNLSISNQDLDIHSVTSELVDKRETGMVMIQDSKRSDADTSPELTPRVDIGQVRQGVKDRNMKKQASMHSVSSNSDRGWAWIVCVACFIIYCIAHGTRFASGILYQRLIKPPCGGNVTDLNVCGGFGASASSTAWVFSLYSGVLQGLAPLVSRLIKHVGCQCVAVVGAIVLTASYISSSFITELYGVFLSYGILGGLGACMLYNSAILMIGSYFHKKRALANGIALSGAGFGGLLITFMASEILKKFSWYGFYRYHTISGALLLISALVLSPKDVQPGRLYVRRHSARIKPIGEQQARKYGQRYGNNLTSRHARISTRLKGSVEFQINALRNRKRPRMLVLMTVGFLMYDSVFFIPYFLAPEGTGINLLYSTYITTSSLGLGAIVMGLVGNRPEVNPVLLQAISFFAMGVSCLLPVFTSSAPAYYVFSALYGLFNGCAWSLFLPTMVVVLGTTHLRRYIGIIFFIGMIGTMTGPPAAGALFDMTKSYPAVFAMTLGFLVGGSGCLFIVYYLWHKQHVHEQLLLRKSRLANMMRHLAQETTTREETEDIPRANRPFPLLHSLTQGTLSNFGGKALNMFRMPDVDDLIDEVYKGRESAWRAETPIDARGSDGSLVPYMYDVEESEENDDHLPHVSPTPGESRQNYVTAPPDFVAPSVVDGGTETYL